MAQDISKLKCCSPKILPLVYDDALSYYEQICKLTSKVNELIDIVIGEGLDPLIEKLILEKIHDILPQALYDAEHERIVLTEIIVSGGDNHVYTQADETMSIV